MTIPAWVEIAVSHPLTTLATRAAIGVIAVGFVTAAGYVSNTNATIADVKRAQLQTSADYAVRFQKIEGTVDALTKRADLGREDRLTFQKDTTEMLQTILEQNQQILSGQAEVSATVRAMDSRITRLENQKDADR